MSFHLSAEIDYSRHNEEVNGLMKAFGAGNPPRVPVIAGGSITNYLLNPQLNVNRWSFREFFENVEKQIKAQLEYQKWERFNIYCDREMGLPEKGWQLSVDFQNSYEASWMGCPVKYWEWRVPDTEEILREHKERLYDLPEIMEIKNGIISRGIEFYEYMHDKCPGMEFEGRPVLPPLQVRGEGTDGPFTLAAKLRGTEELLIDMLTDEKYFHDLMSYITKNIIIRIKGLKEYRWRKYPGSPDRGLYKRQGFYFADDSIALLSLNQYREYVYPYHRRIFDELSDGSPAFVHLCGDSTRHFKFMKDNLNVGTFDTGFPVDHGKLRKELGPDVTINGGPTVMLIKDGTHAEIEMEVKRICRSGVMNGGRFVLIAANNLAPCTPVENVAAFYEAGKKYGRMGDGVHAV